MTFQSAVLKVVSVYDTGNCSLVARTKGYQVTLEKARSKCASMGEAFKDAGWI